MGKVKQLDNKWNWNFIGILFFWANVVSSHLVPFSSTILLFNFWTFISPKGHTHGLKMKGRLTNNNDNGNNNLFSSNYPISLSSSIFHFLGLVKLLTLSCCPICVDPLSNFPGFLKSLEFIHCYCPTPQVHILCQFPRLVHSPRVLNSSIFIHLWKNINLGFVLLPSTNGNKILNWIKIQLKKNKTQIDVENIENPLVIMMPKRTLKTYKSPKNIFYLSLLKN